MDWIQDLLNERSIHYVTFESDESSLNMDLYDAVLEIKEGGAWEFTPAKDKRLS